MHIQANTSKGNAVKFGSNYGYRFNGDNVELNASFQVLSDDAQQFLWTLQLRASPASGNFTEPLDSDLVAEGMLPPFSTMAAVDMPFYLNMTATPPAGSAEFKLCLVLVAKDSAGNTETHDIAFFNYPERFVQPRFVGEISHQITGDSLRLFVSSLENPREPANLSGTLSLELWANTEPYTGGTFKGAPLASVIIGHLAGQENRQDLVYDLTLAKPPAGHSQLVLMLREWTGNGYTTRDYFNFALPLEATTEPEPSITAKSSTASPVKIETSKAALTIKKKQSSKKAKPTAKGSKASDSTKTTGHYRPARTSKGTVK